MCDDGRFYKDYVTDKYSEHVSHLAAGDDMPAEGRLEHLVPNNISCKTEIIMYQYENIHHIIFCQTQTCLNDLKKINNSNFYT